MVIKATRWSPDTCSCVIDYDWDDAVPVAARVHTLKNIVNRCPEHILLSNPAVYSAVFDENTRKNKGLQIALGYIPGLTIGDIDWAYDGSRTLILDLPAGKATIPQVNALIGLMTAAFGAGKVIVNRV